MHYWRASRGVIAASISHHSDATVKQNHGVKNVDKQEPSLFYNTIKALVSTYAYRWERALNRQYVAVRLHAVGLDRAIQSVTGVGVHVRLYQEQ